MQASVDKMLKVKQKIGFSNMFAVDACGKSGGICVLWSISVNVSVMEFNSQVLASKVVKGYIVWHFVGFHGPSQHVKMQKAWEELGAILEAIDGLWMCLGDFNVILNEEEKEGGRIGSSSTPNFLREIRFDLRAIDLGFYDSRFTWTNKCWGRNSIRERLDRGISNVSWRVLFPKAVIYHLGAIKSDHCPIMTDTQPVERFSYRPFRFEARLDTRPRKLRGY